MKVLLDVEGFSQHDTSIEAASRNSACGPVTVFTLLNYWMPNACPYGMNELYALLGTTRIGLFTWRMKRRLRKLLGSSWDIETISLEDSLEELQQGRPVAMKFDRYFRFQFRSDFEFSYHWVPLIGFEEVNGEVRLFIHDNGSPTKESHIRKVSYTKNKRILTFVRIRPHSSLV
ncbi:C39 family peptidase [Paenisporosarcina cavernae]|uniref:Peptidase C39-like domain-containing protein n=1 Tax=Paenisporosarcina cavernae TaxID=2320858 RepID=A0A385YT74_9BACL|nr:C39 family peptidase [Paenisporosarcina cavernae]AYC30065.1 hypothetical protein D3873_09330 [Paenisporosarcina cavernae]